MSVGDTVNLQIESDHRRMIMCNHSATHLLHESLRRVLGDHVTQKGSQVSAEKLRFDFSHQKSLDSDEITMIEETINNLIRDDSEVMVEVFRRASPKIKRTVCPGLPPVHCGLPRGCEIDSMQRLPDDKRH